MLTSCTNVRYFSCTYVKGDFVMAKKKLAALSPAETEVLRIVWQLGKATVQEVADELPDRPRAEAS